jgi:hypothetical protein
MRPARMYPAGQLAILLTGDVAEYDVALPPKVARMARTPFVDLLVRVTCTAPKRERRRDWTSANKIIGEAQLDVANAKAALKELDAQCAVGNVDLPAIEKQVAILHTSLSKIERALYQAMAAQGASDAETTMQGHMWCSTHNLLRSIDEWHPNLLWSSELMCPCMQRQPTHATYSPTSTSGSTLFTHQFKPFGQPGRLIKTNR